MKAVNPSQALASTVVDEFVRCGLAHVCISPGSRSAPLAMAAARHPALRLHVVLDERSAAFCALGIARATGVPAAVVCTSGTAAANFHPAVIEADLDAVPLLVLTADRPPELRGTGANQTADQIKLYGSTVRWFCEAGAPMDDPGAPRYWRSMACRAWAESLGSPRGPVHVNFAFPEPLVPVPSPGGWSHPLEGRSGGRPWTARAPAAAGVGDDVGALARRIAATERGLIVAGAGETDVEPVLDLARRAAWPLLAEPASGLRRGENAVSTYEALLRAPGFAPRHKPDIVLRLGKSGISRVLDAYLAPGVEQVLVDRGGRWLDPGRAISDIVAAEPSALCGAVAETLPGRTATRWLAAWLDAEQAARRAVDDYLDGLDAPTEPRTARDVADALPDGANLVVAASMPVRDLDWFMRPRAGLRVLANRGANGIDGFVSTSIGIAIGSDAPTAALCGDLALIHDQNGLLPARAERIRCTFVVINNDGGGIFSFLPQARFDDVFERLFGTPHGMDFAELAAAHGAGYVRVHRAGELSAALRSALEHDGPTIVEVRTDRRANVEVHRGAWEAVERALPVT